MSVREPLTPLSSNIMSTPKRPTPTSKFGSPSTSGQAHFPAPGYPFTKEHNDEVERKNRRRSKVIEIQRKAGVASSPDTPNRRRSTPLNGLTSDQLSDHYASCIKLSTENKINAKNAFGLHLIDHMTDLLKKRELDNFQVASATLDASAKIYAGRVDCLHSETHKVLMDLGRVSEKDSHHVEETEHGEENVNEENVRKRKKISKTRTLETNLKNLDINKVDLVFEVDPMFQIMSAAFDEGGVKGLLLNKLQCFDDQQLLVLDSASLVSIIDDKNIPERKCQSIDTNDIAELPSGPSLENKSICPQFENFQFSNWDSTDTSSILPSSEYAFDVNAEVEPVPEMEEDVETDMGLAYDSENENEGFETGESQSDAESSLNKGDNNAAKLVDKAFKELMHGSAGSLMQILSTEQSDFSYFKKNLMKTWSGPSHWKLAPLQNDSKNVSKKAKVKKQAFFVDYDEDIELEKPFRKSKATTLTKATLTKYNKSQTTTPDDKHFDPDNLCGLFSKPQLKMKRHAAKDVGVDDAVQVYDYDNANDKDNYCPGDLGAGDDDDDDDHGFNFTAGCGDYSHDSQETTVNPNFLQDTMFDGSALSGDKLLSQPYKIAKINIGYAKTAKNIDVRKLKGSMWRLLATPEKKDTPEEQVTEELNMSQEWSFQSLLEELPEKVSTNTAKNLSVPITFACLLHLANEKTLKITSDEELKDLKISKDLG